MGASIDISSYEIPVDTKVLRGLPSTLVDLSPVIAVEGSDHDGPYSEIVVPDKFPPGSIMLFATQLQGADPSLDEFCKSGVDEAFKDLNVIDLNVLLFRCDGEERDATGKFVFKSCLAVIHHCNRWPSWSLRCTWTRKTRLLWIARVDDSTSSSYAVQRSRSPALCAPS
jgi:hypothetical protein